MIFLIAFTTMLQVSASSYGQKINISQHNISLEQGLKLIRQQSGYDILFDANVVRKILGISINLKNGTTDAALKMCLTGTDLTYEIEQNTILIKQSSLLKRIAAQISAQFNTVDINGYVYVANGREVLAGATITVKRTKRSVYSGAKGIFEIKGVLPSDSLVVSYIGYKSKTVIVGDKPNLFIYLEESSNPLDVLVVQGYGKITQRLATGNISRVSSTDISTQLLTNPILALQGAIPGLEITSVDGNDFGLKRIELRGRKSINSNISSEPLIILDGIPQMVLNEVNRVSGIETQSQITSNMGVFGATANNGFSPLYNINPSDIESIEVLKDADATAIYGSRGGNGVILITTKKGKVGKTSLNAHVNQGIRMVIDKWDLLNTEEYLAMRKEKFKNDGITPTVSNAPELLRYDQNRYTDWQDVIYGGTGKWSTFEANVAGGDAYTRFRISSSLNQNKDISNYKGLNQRFSNSFSLSHITLNKRFKFDLSGSYSLTQNNQVTIRSGHLSPPNAPSIFTEAGDLNFLEWQNGMANFVGLKTETKMKGAALNTAGKISYTPVDNLDIFVNLGYNQNSMNSRYTTPLSSFDKTSTELPLPSIILGGTEVKNVIIEPQITYNRVLGRGKLETLIGATYQDNSTSNDFLKASGFTADEQMKSINGAPEIRSMEALKQYKYAGVFARINYNWENKYIVNLNGRRDGSSRFGEDYRFGNFGSVGASWILSEEQWIKSMLPKFISFVKLRGSYGIVGSDGVGDYMYLTQWGYTNNSQKLPAYEGISSVIPQIQPNSEFHWQKNTKTEISLSLAFFKEKIGLDITRYTDFTGNQLLQFPTPNYTGFSNMVFNSPAEVRNKGIEISLSARVINTKNISFNTSFNFSRNSNTLTAYPDFEYSPYYNSYKIGQSLNNLYVFKSLGVNADTGEYEFLDHNGDGQVQYVSNVPAGEQGDDRFIAINTSPEFFGGLTQQIRFKNISLAANFYYSKKKAGLSIANSGNENIRTYVYENSWREPGQQALFSKLTNLSKLSNGQYVGSDAYYVDADFLRLKALQLSYHVSSKALKAFGVSNLTVNATAQNIFVITKLKGLDPEVINSSGLPQTRTVTMGLNCSF